MVPGSVVCWLRFLVFEITGSICSTGTPACTLLLERVDCVLSLFRGNASEPSLFVPVRLLVTMPPDDAMFLPACCCDCVAESVITFDRDSLLLFLTALTTSFSIGDVCRSGIEDLLRAGEVVFLEKVEDFSVAVAGDTSVAACVEGSIAGDNGFISAVCSPGVNSFELETASVIAAGEVYVSV